jgi:hypothetical protein
VLGVASTTVFCFLYHIHFYMCEVVEDWRLRRVFVFLIKIDSSTILSSIR